MQSSSRNTRNSSASIFLLGYIVCTFAHANPGDPLQVSAGVAYSHDNNLFRLGDNDVGYDGQRGDFSRQTIIGLTYDQTFNRQVLSLQGKFSDIRYDHFTQLNYHGKDFQAKLNWYIGHNLDGNLGSVYNSTLASYADVRSNQRVLRQREYNFFDGGWRLHPHWRLRMALSRDKASYDLASVQVINRIDTAYETGLDYSVGNGSTVGVLARRTEGRYPLQGSRAHSVFDSSYNQDEAKLRVVWRISKDLDTQLTAGRVRRSHLYISDEDSNGFNTRLVGNWGVTNALQLSASAWREYAPLESTLVSYSLNRGGNLAAVWNHSNKLRFDTQLRYERRAFGGLAPGVNLALAEGDNTRQTSLGAIYAPLAGVQFRASLYRDRRSGASLFGLGAYHANGYSLNANLQF
ncbi:XrtB/PEP-CTERM-associated polysaccharide biosynthesis outer membrane protein EpsL [Duganella fentianensis]|uniref:XrtB/PEP-CTERM-associated polysaccharide biosynthesis outer membrane protein EpsL n=1 Tax=Duganella fentianensis TaxID=2692177 RepID=UPI0032B18792